MLQCYGGPMDGAMVAASEVPLNGVLRKGIHFRTYCEKMAVFEWNEPRASFTVTYKRVNNRLIHAETKRL